MIRILLLSLFLLVQASAFAQPFRFSFLQINDIYEISPLSGGMQGGPARVATLHQQLSHKAIPHWTILAGDFLSPSVMNQLPWKDAQMMGVQLVDILNAVGVDLVTFGNHEFDLKYPNLQKRINESKFDWISSNVWFKEGNQLQRFARTLPDRQEFFKPCTTLIVVNAKNDTLRVGVIGVTLQAFIPSYAQIDSVIPSARKWADTLKIRDHADVLIAITHLSIEEDRALAQALPELALIMGGHEHENHIEKVGNVVIAKADANVRSVYIHTLQYSKLKKAGKVSSQLKKITPKIKDNPEVLIIAQRWKQYSDSLFRQKGFFPDSTLVNLKVPLDGLESSVRNHPTNLGSLIAKSFQQACPSAVAGILNGGSIRIDDEVSGKLTEYDVLRILPFGGEVVEVEMKGSLIKQILKAGETNKGSGGYLQYAGITKTDLGTWEIQGNSIADDQYYAIALTDFLLTGKEKNLGWLLPTNPGIRGVQGSTGNEDPRRDVRMAVISYLRKGNTDY